MDHDAAQHCVAGSGDVVSSRRQVSRETADPIETTLHQQARKEETLGRLVAAVLANGDPLPGRVGPLGIVHLQRNVGNRATATLVSASLAGVLRHQLQPARAVVTAGGVERRRGESVANAMPASRANPVVVARQQQSDAGRPSQLAGSDLRVNPAASSTEEMEAELRRMQDIRDNQSDRIPAKELEGFLERVKKLEGHIAERGMSTLPDAAVELLFDGKTLTMSGALTASLAADSGKPDKKGEFDYSVARQQQQDVGPIPEGTYWIEPEQMQPMRFRRGSAAGWGTHRITIHPFDTTNTFGRGGFFIHGGTSRGSAGCVDLTAQVADFAEKLGEVAEGHKVKLLVRYPDTKSVPKK